MPGRTGLCILILRINADMIATACQHCGADVSGVAQTACETYDHVEIPDIEPDVARVTLHGGVFPCCAKKFKAAPRLAEWSPALRSGKTCAPLSFTCASPMALLIPREIAHPSDFKSPFRNEIAPRSEMISPPIPM
jgi:hypothetical protein